MSTTALVVRQPCWRPVLGPWPRILWPIPLGAVIRATVNELLHPAEAPAEPEDA